MNTVIYCRVSTQEQVDDGLSLITQQRICREFLSKHGYKLATDPFIEEGESAKTAERPVLKELMKYCKENAKDIDAVVIYKVDRLSRNTNDYHVLRAFFNSCNISVVSASEPLEDSPFGRFMETTLASIAQLDNEIRGERSKNGMIEALKQGRYIFRSPLGYNKISGRGIATVEPDGTYSKYIQEIFERIAASNTSSLEDIRLDINQSLKAHQLKLINKSHFYKIIVNPVYKGWIILDTLGVNQKGTFKSLVSEELFNKVQFILSGKSKKLPKYKMIHPDFPLRGTIKHSCGKYMTANWAKKKYPHYRCTHCKRVNLHKEDVEADFVKYLKGINLKSELTDAIKFGLQANWEYRKKDVIKIRQKLEKDKSNIETSQHKVVDKNIKGVYSDHMTKKMLSELEMQQSEIDLELMKYRAPEDDVNDLVEFSLTFLENMDQIWEQGEPELKHQFQKFVFFDGVTYDQREFRTNDKPLSVKMNESLVEANYPEMTLRRIELRLPG